MANSFEERFERDVEPLLQNPETYEQAIGMLEKMMPALSGKEERSQAYQWMATVHLTLASSALSAGEADEARSRFDLVEEFLLKAIDEDGTRIEPRLRLARYYLTFGNDPWTALEGLEPRDGQDLPAAEEHERLALRGVAMTVLGRNDEALEALEGAYSAELLREVPSRRVDLSVFRYLALRGVRLDPESARQLIGRLRDAGTISEARIEHLEKELLGGTSVAD